MSTVKFDTWQNTDGTENYKCRAWVNFNGTGTVAIRASGNVSSITDNAVGDYTANFINAMPDTNYAVGGGATGYTTQARSATISGSSASVAPYLMTTTQCRICYGGNGTVDGYVTTMMFFR